MIDELRLLWRTTAFFGRVSLCIAGAAAGAHLLALTGRSFGGPLAAFYALHVAVLLLGVALVARLTFGRRRAVANTPPSVEPRRLRWLVAFLGVYLLAWFLGTFAYYGEGGPQLRNGRYVWIDAGRVSRTLTEAQHATFQANIARVFSSAWLFAATALALGHVHLDVQGAGRSPSRREP